MQTFDAGVLSSGPVLNSAVLAETEVADELALMFESRLYQIEWLGRQWRDACFLLPVFLKGHCGSGAIQSS